MSSRRRRRHRSRPASAPPRRLPWKRLLPAMAGLALAALAVAYFALRPADPAAALARAQDYAEAGDMRAARVEAMNAVQGDAGNAEAWLLLARSQLALGDFAGAATTVARARGAGVPAGATRHLAAEAALGTGDIETALAETAAGDVAPRFAADAVRMRGRAYAMDGRIDDAVRMFNAAIAAAPDSAPLWVDIARFRIGTGEIGGAIDAADRAVELDPRNIDALVLKGRLVRDQYGLAAALPWFERALEIDENHVGALIDYASTLGEIGRMGDMLAATRRVRALDPMNAEAFYLEAVMAARARNFRLARRLVELIGGRLDGRPSMALLEAGIDYHERNYEAVIQRLGRLLDAQPANRAALRLLGGAQFHAGDMNAVLATLGPLAERADADSYTLTLVGRALERQGNLAAAAPFLQRAQSPVRGGAGVIGGGPRDAAELALLERDAAGGGAPAEVALIRAYLALGRTGDALARAERLRNANPRAPDAHILYGDALGAAGRFADAAGAYASAANIRFSEAVVLRMVEALERAGQPGEAQRTLALFRQQNPRNIPTALLSAQINLRAGRWAQAAAILENLRARVGDRDAAILANLAWAVHETGDHDRARALARRAYLLMPMNPATTEIFGWVEFDGGGDRRQGLELLLKARALAPDDPGVAWHLAQAYAALDRPREARVLVRAALAHPRFGARDEALALLRTL